MLISRFATLFLAPLGLLFSAYGLLPLSLLESIVGAFFGYVLLFTINALFKRLRNQDGIGDGDFDLLLFIGAFTGIIGCWISITIGSMIGSFYGLFCMLSTHNRNEKNISLLNSKIPFGPLLAFGAIIFVFFQRYFQLSLA